LMTRPEESYRLWCVVVCDLETSRMRRPWPALGRSATGKKSFVECLFLFCIEFLSGSMRSVLEIQFLPPIKFVASSLQD